MVVMSLFSSATDLTSELGADALLQNEVVLRALEEMVAAYLEALKARYIVIVKLGKCKQKGS